MKKMVMVRYNVLDEDRRRTTDTMVKWYNSKEEAEDDIEVIKHNSWWHIVPAIIKVADKDAFDAIEAMKKALADAEEAFNNSLEEV